ncbi:MAG TPA: amidohydrolase family protein [Bacteroidales bacterium]|nr:amidohydrolase [Bacteroidales bacterium]HOU95970.1 amidohydrolase family protein [Bacteroidales bacterium]HQG36525.1 amidohydrolase family protein [Bacteroidales bacterium]HQG53015.1 amidohydrolase family protein [Bacteroidales bacterium]HQJ20637.1 amidohydrolase family protein [Bacteroidales bacterium]
MIIDTHHHFWRYNPEEFGWIDENMTVIKRNFLPEDLQKTLINTNVGGVISVQARQTIAETDWLLHLASENDFIKGVIGWLPLGEKNFGQLLEKYADNCWLKGLRHVIQDEPDPDFILGDSFNHGINLLRPYDLVYDILIFDYQLPNTIRFVDRHPAQQFVLDHIAKPRIKFNEIKTWQQNLVELAKRENVYCKISGMVTEADYKKWTISQLHPYFEAVLEAFGPSRLMFGSDWPVCLVAINYEDWIKLVIEELSDLSVSEQEQIFSKNAIRIYRLEMPMNNI